MAIVELVTPSVTGVIDLSAASAGPADLVVSPGRLFAVSRDGFSIIDTSLDLEVYFDDLGLTGRPLIVPPATTALGSLLAYITHKERKAFQPMNANYGLFPPLTHRLRGREKKLALAERALHDLSAWQETHGLGLESRVLSLASL